MSTRPFSTPTGDRFLCEKHKAERLSHGMNLGVPTSAPMYMMGLLPWPTGEEPCFDCASEEEPNDRPETS